jgi:hypothetical protein
MILKAIEKILSLGGTKVEIINGRTYGNGPAGIIPIKPPKAETLTINTLTGIVDLMPLDSVQLEERDVMLHVVDHKSVSLMDHNFSDHWLTRSTYLTAVHESPVFRFGQFMDVETFIIHMQAMFVQDESTAAILKVAGNIKEEAVTQFSDDGVTQGVTAKAGISRVEVVPVPNPVTLRPYRTFMEIEQPMSTFVFRMQGGKGNSPTCALFEADGRMWQLEAIKNIKLWLSEKIPRMKIIA